jgi:hypothetical protein
LLSYFRINDPYRLLGFLLVVTLIYLPFFLNFSPLTYPEFKSLLVGERVLNGSALYVELIDSTAPLTGWFQAVVTFLLGESLLSRHILSLLIIVLQAVFIGIVYLDKKVFPESTFVPTLIFGMLYAFSFDNLMVSGELLGSGVILLALNSLFKELEFREDSLEMVLKLGFFIGIASLFEFSFIVFVPGSLFILFLFTRSSGRKFALVITGFLIPHLLVLGYYFILGGASDLWRYFYLPNFAFYINPLLPWKTLAALLITPVVFVLAALVAVNRETRFTKYQSQVMQAMFFWMIFACLQVLYSKEIRPQSFTTLVPAFAFFISHLVLTIRRRFLAEVVLWVLLGGMLGLSYYSARQAPDSEEYSAFVLKEVPANPQPQKIVTLSADLQRYRGNSMSTPFLNWALSKPIFEEPGYYKNITRVYEGFKNDPPDIILDPHGLMTPFMQRIPELENSYVPTDEGYRRKSPASN